jgi:hypothetical protein
VDARQWCLAVKKERVMLEMPEPSRRGRKNGNILPVPKPKKDDDVVIKAPNLQTAKVLIRGTSPIVTNAFPQKARNAIMETQMAGSQSRKGKKRDPKNFDEVYEGACHYSRQGWLGFSASAIRAASISACRLVGFKMTLAKLSIFVVADGFDRVDGTPLVKITKGKPIKHYMHARPELGGIDIRVRPQWEEGWEAVLTMRWDADQFSANDVINLLMRVGQQIGVGEGRYDSKKSAGLGWGCFEVIQ